MAEKSNLSRAMTGCLKQHEKIVVYRFSLQLNKYILHLWSLSQFGSKYFSDKWENSIIVYFCGLKKIPVEKIVQRTLNTKTAFALKVIKMNMPLYRILSEQIDM